VAQQTAPLKNIQLRLTPDVHEAIKDIAQERGMTIADLIREALQFYQLNLVYMENGKRLYYQDPVTGDRVEVIPPGLMRSLRMPAERAALMRQ
jgi:Ribbon-helix-helix protein, copG family